jgi:diguanylate cyclase (GGDEF)-like protein
MQKPTVLVVDGDAFSRAAVTKKIAHLAEAIESADGLDALARLKTTPVDLAIVDLDRPNVNGIDLVASIRNHCTLQHIPIIILTANETRGGLESALLAGATSFLPKPLNWSAFGEHVRHVLELVSRASYVALHDDLTGLPNRALLNDRIKHALISVKPGAMTAIHIIDLDHFNYVNDTLGHPAGDTLLKMVGDRLRRLVREADTVARLGGDEFSILQLEMRKQTDAALLARRIIQAVREPYELAGRQVILDATVGIDIAASADHKPEQLMRNADVALYRGKREGRGMIRFFEPAMDVLVKERAAMECELRKGLRNGEFELYYQPTVKLASNKICGFEALIRWHHPEKGLVKPGAFVPIAEDIGLIVPIGEWVIREACNMAAQWPEDLKIAVNISPVHFLNPGLVQTVVAALAASGLAPHRLELEITETNFLQNTVATLTALRELRTIGVRIAMDDFGTGYSSLSYLHSFAFDKIKIDRSFVEKITENASSLNIVRAVAALAHGLNMASTAEGVETDEQLAKIKAAGYTEVQGFLFSEPIPAREVAPLLLFDRLPSEVEASAAAA